MKTSIKTDNGYKLFRIKIKLIGGLMEVKRKYNILYGNTISLFKLLIININEKNL